MQGYCKKRKARRMTTCLSVNREVTYFPRCDAFKGLNGCRHCQFLSKLCESRVLPSHNHQMTKYGTKNGSDKIDCRSCVMTRLEEYRMSKVMLCSKFALQALLDAIKRVQFIVCFKYVIFKCQYTPCGITQAAKWPSMPSMSLHSFSKVEVEGR